MMGDSAEPLTSLGLVETGACIAADAGGGGRGGDGGGGRGDGGEVGGGVGAGDVKGTGGRGALFSFGRIRWLICVGALPPLISSSSTKRLTSSSYSLFSL